MSASDPPPVARSKSAIGLARRLERDDRGAALLLATVFMLTLLSVVAVAVDFGQAMVLKQKLHNAADAAALAVGSRLDLTDTEANALAQNFIKANYPDLALGTLTQFTVTPTNVGYNVRVAASLPTTFLRVLGTETLQLAVTAEVTRDLRKLEVVLALDNTGSMTTNDRIGKLRRAANSLVDILFDEADVSPHVKIGLVPFSGAVNLGLGALGRGWIDENGASALNREDVALLPARPSLLQLFQSMNNVPWGGCVRARLGGHDLLDTPPSLASPETLFTPYFAPDEAGNIVVNGSGNSYLIGDGTLPALYALQGLTAPLIANGNGPNFNCVQRPIQPLTNVRQAIADAITAMQPRGSTVIPEGLAWAWRVISPGLPYDQGADYSDKSVTKVVILLSDGRNQVERGAPYNSFYSAYGFATKGHIGRTDGSQTRQVLNAKTAALCNNIKADKDGNPSTDDIFVYTIALEIDTGNAAVDAETKSLLEACATPAARCPGQQCFYDTPSSNELDQVFSKIAIGLAGLRIAK
jgi:Flp pilus assembly protein TadG